ncbi:MAG: DUF1344 domain-containing protein [Rhodobacteraceae bacterium]|nr:DUF1344 domain-containing protein [Paracoccaceae bacterium]
MRSHFLPVLFVAAIGLGSAAMAAGYTATGTIKALDAATHEVTLQDGTVYTLPKTFNLDAFKVGEKVNLTWEMNGKLHEASTMTAAG